MWAEKSYSLKSVSPMLMHSGQTADPTNRFAKSLKQISSKRSKTDADFEEMARIEFIAGLYMNVDGPIIPAENLTAMLIKAAKKRREGPGATSGMFVLEHSRLEYEGPRNAAELWEDERFRHVALVRVQTSRIARTRPIFHEWTAVVKVTYETEQVNERQLSEWFDIAGSQIGIGDWRPRFGRFVVE
jgi:hypothetical protein